MNNKKHEKKVDKILSILREDNSTPLQVRYIFKRVREKGKYQIQATPKRLPDYLNDVEIGAILNLSLQKDKTTALIIPLAIFTGMRINEITNLQVQHIDLTSYQIKIVQGKGSKDRFILINYELASKIKSYIGDRKAGFLFVKKNLTPYTKRALQKKIENTFKELSLDKKLSAHSLRHTYATLLLRRGMSLDRIQLLLGHSKRATTEIYAHLELEPVKQEYFKLMGF